MTRKAPPAPKVKACARCNGKRPANRRRLLEVLGLAERPSVVSCEACEAFCPHATDGKTPLYMRQCLRKTWHEGLHENRLRQVWKAGDTKPTQLGTVLTQ